MTQNEIIYNKENIAVDSLRMTHALSITVEGFLKIEIAKLLYYKI
jgi:hypothetical protein